jgi:hypothetical protein
MSVPPPGAPLLREGNAPAPQPRATSALSPYFISKFSRKRICQQKARFLAPIKRKE